MWRRACLRRRATACVQATTTHPSQHKKAKTKTYSTQAKASWDPGAFFNPLNLPICHGASLPAGGKGAHAVIAGYRGFANSELFTRLDEFRKATISTLKYPDPQSDTAWAVSPSSNRPTRDCCEDRLAFMACGERRTGCPSRTCTDGCRDRFPIRILRVLACAGRPGMGVLVACSVWWP